MYWTFYPYNQDEHILKSFQALVDVIIPRTPDLAKEYGIIQYYGALDAYTDEFIFLSLQNLPNPLAGYAADLLNTAAELVTSEGYRNKGRDIDGLFFEASPEKRVEVLELIKLSTIFPANFPKLMQDNPDLILYTYSFLIRYSMLGYYSEWFGYGTTRLNPPAQRKLEYYPFSWEQIDYPGPSSGYHALRNNV